MVLHRPVEFTGLSGQVAVICPVSRLMEPKGSPSPALFVGQRGFPFLWWEFSSVPGGLRATLPQYGDGSADNPKDAESYLRGGHSSLGANCGTSAFHQDNITPTSIHASKSCPSADHSEPRLHV
jgi:hypothetical protein